MDRSKADIRRILMRSKAPEFARLMILSMLEGAEDTFDAMSSVLKAELSQSRISEDKFLQTFEELIGLLRKKLSGDAELSINCTVENELTPSESPKSPTVPNNLSKSVIDGPMGIRELSQAEAEAQEEAHNGVEIVIPIITEPDEEGSLTDEASIADEMPASNNVVEELQSKIQKILITPNGASASENKANEPNSASPNDSTDDDFSSVKEEDYLTPAQDDEDFELMQRRGRIPKPFDTATAPMENNSLPAKRNPVFDGLKSNRVVLGYVNEPGQRFPKKIFGRKSDEGPPMPSIPLGRRNDEPGPSGSVTQLGATKSTRSSLGSQPSSSKQVRKGEEGETVWLETDCTLHQFFNKSDIRKRGSGTMRVLEHMTTGVMRCVMYSHKDDSIFSNFVVTKQFECRTGAKSDCIVTWNCLDTHSLTPEIPGTFVCSFTTPEQAVLFQKILKTYGPNAEDKK